MENLAKNHQRWIKGFTKDQFDILVTSVIKNYWGMDEIIITDSKGDGGIDIKIYDAGRQIKEPIQVTIDNKVYGKLKLDLPKIAETIKNYGYSNKFTFFYSGSAEETNIEELKLIARRDFDINLDFFDSKRIGAIAEMPLCSGVRSCIKNLLGTFLSEPVKTDKFENIKYDLFVYGSENTDIRKGLFKSFILFELFSKGSIHVAEICSQCETKFSLENKNYISVLMEELKKAGKISIDNDKKVTLKEDELQRITKIRDDSVFQEQYLELEIKQLINKFAINLDHNLLIEKILGVYVDGYKQELLEIQERPDEYSYASKIIKELQSLIESNIPNKGDLKNITDSIFEICEYNDNLQRIAAGQTFLDITKVSQIESYLRRQPKYVYLDTPILLYIFCNFYFYSKKYENKYIQTAKDLMTFRDTIGVKLIFKTSRQYIREVAFQLRNSFRLAELTKLDFFEELGGTNNVFYHFYKHLGQNDELPDDIETFEDFLYDLCLSEEILDNESTLDVLEENVKQIFLDNEIEVDDIYDNSLKNQPKKIFDEIKKILEIIHSYDYRPDSTIVNDALMMTELYNDTIFDSEPVFLTWDKSFHEARRIYQSNHPSAFFWHLFRPSRFIDHISVLKFKINSSVINRDLLSLLEEDFDLQGKTKKISDVLSRLVNLKTEGGIKLSKGIAEIKRNSIYQLSKSNFVTESTSDIRSHPVDAVMFSISAYFSRRQGKFSFADFASAVKDESVAGEFLEILKSESGSRYEKYEISEKIKLKMDDIIQHFKDRSSSN